MQSTHLFFYHGILPFRSLCIFFFFCATRIFIRFKQMTVKHTLSRASYFLAVQCAVYTLIPFHFISVSSIILLGHKLVFTSYAQNAQKVRKYYRYTLDIISMHASIDSIMFAKWIICEFHQIWKKKAQQKLCCKNRKTQFLFKYYALMRKKTSINNSMECGKVEQQ